MNDFRSISSQIEGEPVCRTVSIHREDNHPAMKMKLPARRYFEFVAIFALGAVTLTLNSRTVNAQAPAAAAPQPLTAEAMKGKTAGEFYKNVKVLKDVPAANLHNAMEYITVALGVGCGYCHVPGKFDSDDRREKNVARSMMAMTMAINANVFDGKRELTCFTCHRGLPKGAPTFVFPGEKAPTEPSAAEIFPPLQVKNITALDPSMSPSKAPATVVSGSPAAAKPADSPMAPLPAVADVFKKYTQALGGDAAIGKVTSIMEKGTVEMLVPPPPARPGTPAVTPAMGNVSAEVDRKLPMKERTTIQFPGRPPTLEGFDGKVSYAGAREEAGGELDLREEFAEFPPGLKFAENHSNVQVDASEKIGDRDAYRVVGTRLDGSAIDRLYFDAQSGLLLRSYTTMQSPIGSFPEETNYADYRDVSGFKVPFTLIVLSPEGNRTYRWSQVDLNVPIEDSQFAKPLPPPPPPRPAAN